MKNHDRRSALQARCALWIALGCAALAPLGCSDDKDDGANNSTAGTAGSGGSGGAGGTAGEGGSAGTGGGESDGGGESCGGIANIQCTDQENMYCEFPEKSACGAGDMAGICRPRPTECSQECTGACGCDGRFYCNACEANRAGTDDVPVGTCGDASTLR
jgi:hypothetical protein